MKTVLKNIEIVDILAEKQSDCGQNRKNSVIFNRTCTGRETTYYIKYFQSNRPAYEKSYRRKIKCRLFFTIFKRQK